jgi:excisionase family DNA binding protein
MRETLEPPRLLDAATVARIFGVDASTIHRWLKAGKLRAVRLGKSPRFTRSEIEALIGEPLVEEPVAETTSSDTAQTPAGVEAGK